MKTRTQGLQRVLATLERIQILFFKEGLFDVRAWGSMSGEGACPVHYQNFSQQTRAPLGGFGLVNTYDLLLILRDELDRGVLSPAEFMVQHLRYIDRQEDARSGLGKAPKLLDHMRYLLYTAASTISLSSCWSPTASPNT
jgi:hypothetical protein